MDSHNQRRFGQTEMNAHTDVANAQSIAARLEGLEARREKLPLADIRKRVARKVSSSPSFFNNLQRGRIKSVPNWLMRKLRNALVEELQAEVHKLQHEIHLARQIGEGPDSDAIFAAEARLAEAKKILGAA
jgi:hypothetical protein